MSKQSSQDRNTILARILSRASRLRAGRWAETMAEAFAVGSPNDLKFTAWRLSLQFPGDVDAAPRPSRLDGAKPRVKPELRPPGLTEHLGQRLVV